MSELLALLTMAKEAGFETGTILSIGFIAWRLRKSTTKEVDKVVEAIKGHNVLLADHSSRLSSIETDVKAIETQVGLNK